MTDRRWFWGLVALAVAARVAAVLALQSHLVPRSTFEHGEIAANLLAGRGFAVKFLGGEGPTSQQAPAYPLLVATAYAVGGVETPRALLLLELGQAVLGGWLVAETIRLARSVAPGRRWVATGAGLAVAVHPTLVYAATHVQVAGLAAALLVATLARAYEARTWRDAFGVGLWLAALMLTDPILGLVAPGAAWAIVRGTQGDGLGPVLTPRPALRLKGGGFSLYLPSQTQNPPPLRRRAGWGVDGVGKPHARVAAMAFAAAIGISPWVVRNAVVHGEFVPIKSTFGYAFWQGNCSRSQGTDKVVRGSVESTLTRDSSSLRDLNRSLWAARHEAGYIDDIALTKADYAILGLVSEPERSRILFRRALHELKGRPGRYLSLCLRRLRYFVLFDETNPKTRSRLYRIGHVGLTAVALIGLALAPRDVRRRLGPTLLTVGLIAAFHALTIVSARFHLPIEPLLAIWAGSGLARFSAAAEPAGEVEGIGVAHRLGGVRDELLGLA